MITVLLADDQALLRDGLRVILGAEDDIAVVGAARDGAEAVARRLHPDVVLCDLRMPGTDGVEATAQITADPDLAATRVVVLTTYDHDDLVLRALRAGAAAYLLKDLPAADLIAALRAVVAGQTILQPPGARRVVAALSRAAPVEAPEARAHLTEREMEVLRLVASGRRNREIADARGVSEATVKTHVNNIFAKLGARDRAGAVVRALELGLVPPP